MPACRAPPLMAFSLRALARPVRVAPGQHRTDPRRDYETSRWYRLARARHRFAGRGADGQTARTLTLTAYDTGSSGFNIAVAIAR